MRGYLGLTIGVVALAILSVERGYCQETGNRAGGDYANFWLDWGQCRAACEADARCQAWTYVKPGFHGPAARCWLKTVVPQLRAHACCISGVKATVVADPACDAYSRTAVEQANQARQAACRGIGGPRWDSTYQQHHGWCRSVSQAARDDETRARTQTLVACAAPGFDPACDLYARTAVQQSIQARSARCKGITGPTWDATYQDHYGWCRRVPQAARDHETQIRAKTLVSCGTAAGGAGPCADPRVLPIMDEWLRLALPPQQPGESLRYDQWGRVLGRSSTGVIEPAGNPDAPRGRCAWLLELAPHLNSMNGYGTLQSYLENKLR
jgi:hypothetical protein